MNDNQPAAAPSSARLSAARVRLRRERDHAGVVLPVPVVCGQCGGTPRKPEDSIVATCPVCYEAYEISLAGPRRIATGRGALHGARPRNSERPFWVFAASITFTYNMNSGLGALLRDRSEEWIRRPGLRLFIPAYRGLPEHLLEQARAMSIAQPEFTIEPAAMIPGAVLTEQEARALADILVGDAEIRRPGVMQLLGYALALDQPRLLLLPV